MDLKSARILIVEDQIVMRDLVRKYLRDLGFNNVETAEDGQVGWSQFTKAIERKEPFDLVICDWVMPKMGGFELLTHIRSHKKNAKTPFIMLTAEAGKDEVARAAQWKIDGYIAKPFTIKTLVEQISKVLTRSMRRAA